MSDYLVTDTELTSIADAIRTKGGTSASLTFPSAFVSAINNIPTGDPAAEAYKALALNDCSMSYSNYFLRINNTTSDTAYLSGQDVYFPASFFSGISRATMGQFAGRKFVSGSTYTFPNCSYISAYAFMDDPMTQAGGLAGFTLDFPSCLTVSTMAFYGCKASSVYLPLTSIMSGSAFCSCGVLRTISMPIVSAIRQSTFYRCYELSIASASLASAIETDAFYYCSSLATISFPSCKNVGQSAFAGCSRLLSVEMPACTILAAYAFNGCYSLSYASFAELTTINASAFAYCSALTSISLPSLISVNSPPFTGCSNLQSIYLSALSSLSVSLFGNLSNLVTISVPNLQYISAYMGFGSCINLSTISFPKLTTLSGNYVFSKCYNLLSIYLMASTMCELRQAATNIFPSTPIMGYTASTGGVYGSIYVPSSLYSQYIVATNWVSISSRFVSI